MAPERLLRAAFCALILAWVAPAAGAGEATIEVPMRDPWVPPGLAKQARIGPASSGAQLQAEVDRKLRARFESAADPSGVLTRQGARSAGLGFIDRHFDEIDQRHTGRVTYEDFRRFLRERGASLE